LTGQITGVIQMSTKFNQKSAQRKGFRKILAMGTLLLISAGLSGIAPSVSTTSAVGDSHGDWYVNASVDSSGDGKSESEAFKTIAEAINDVDTKDGDTIQVLEGTYDGFTVTKSVKILGPNDKIHPQDMSKDVPTPNPDRLTGEAVINGMVTFAAGIDDITLSGFKLVTSTEPAGVRVTTSDNVTITYNDFSSGGWPIDAQQSGLASTWVVSHNRIDDITEDVQTAIYLVNITNLTVENNFIRHDNPEADNRRGVNLDSSKNVTFTGNNIDMGARGVELPTTKALWAIQLAMDEGAVEDVTIENNWIRGARTGISGLSKNSLTNVAIRQNTIYDTLSGIVLDQGGVPPLPGVSPVTAGLEISGNDITFFEYGVWLRGVTQWLHGKEFKYSDVAISGNRFTLSPPPTDSSCTARGKGLGAGDCKPVRVYEKTFIDGFNTGKINARGNFWGTEEGPSANQKEESQVDSGGWISAYDDDPAKVNHPGFWPQRNVNLNAGTETVAVTVQTVSLGVEVESGAENARVDYSALLTGGAGTIPQTTITTSGGVTVKIPQTGITADDTNWDGVIKTPTVVANDSVTIPEESGTTVTVATAIKVGAVNIELTFDEAVRVLLLGDADKLVGFVSNGTFTPITTKCSADSQTIGNELAEAGDCFISVGSDMVIWTKHFTTFVVYSVVATPAPAPAPAPSPVSPYNGPIVSSTDKAAVTPGSLVTLSGTKLNVVTKVTVDEVNVAIVSQAASSLTLRLPEAITPGVKTIVLISSFGSVRVQNLVTINEEEVPAVPTPTPELDQKVNAGSFNGVTVIYAKGYEGQRLSAKVAGKWLKVDALDSMFERAIRFTEAGRNIKVDIYIDRVLVDTINLVTK
jgi:hypothetical protein